MQNNFEAKLGAQFNFRATPVPGWSGVTICEVLEIDPPHRLVYSWADAADPHGGFQTRVIWTLTRQADGGTHVRMEHAGVRPEDEGGYRGMSGGWPRILERLETIAGELV